MTGSSRGTRTPVLIYRGRTSVGPLGVGAAFTIVELLVVIGIIAVLTAILLPALSKARVQANELICINNMREIGAAAAMYQVENRNELPLRDMAATGSRVTAWDKMLWKYLTKNPIEVQPKKVKPIGIFKCPFDVTEERFNTNAFAGNYQSYGVNFPLNQFGEFVVVSPALYGAALDPYCVSLKPNRLFDWPYTGGKRSPSTVVYLFDKHTQRWFTSDARASQQAGKFGWYVDFNAYDFGGQTAGYEYDCGHPAKNGPRLKGPSNQGLPNVLYFDLHVQKVKEYPGPASPEVLRQFQYVGVYGGPADKYYKP